MPARFNYPSLPGNPDSTQPKSVSNVQTMVLPRAVLTAEEVAAAVGQQAMFQELASALVEIRQPVVLGFPSAQALRRFFVARRERPGAE